MKQPWISSFIKTLIFPNKHRKNTKLAYIHTCYWTRVLSACTKMHLSKISKYDLIQNCIINAERTFFSKQICNWTYLHLHVPVQIVENLISRSWFTQCLEHIVEYIIQKEVQLIMSYNALLQGSRKILTHLSSTIIKRSRKICTYTSCLARILNKHFIKS